ncbi:MAG TPA: hypothetical protein VNS63_10680, partial [Blastocatellia bacterium]|nr:hypothetical protein [Blastocatellia bacterium]
METIIQDVRYGVRVLRTRPGFTAVAIITLALGIGATTAIFSVVDAVLLRPLPFKDPDRLMMVWEKDLKRGQERDSVSAADYVDWTSRNQAFEQM